MSSKKNNTENCKANNDLTFIPLNIDSNFAPNSAKFPLQFSIDGFSVTKTFGTVSLDNPNLNINPTPMPLNVNPITKMAPLTPYPINIPTMDSNTSLNQTPGSNMSPSISNSNLSSNSNMGLEYPTEPADNFLHSYNEPQVNQRYLDDSVNVLDILRNFDISLDFSISESRKNNCSEEEVDKLFSLIEKDNPGILATMKAYRIPYPIAKLLIKKIIQVSLDNCKR